MHNPYFQTKEYHTPANQKRKIGDILSFGTSIYFNFHFLRVVLRNRKMALRGDYDTKQWAKSSHDILKFLEHCSGKFHIEGFEHVDAVKDEPVVFISNHMGTLETMVFPCLIAPVKEVVFVVKESLTQNKIFGPIMRARTPIAVGRNDSRQDLMKVMSEGKEFLSKGTSIIIFPQATRTVEFSPEKFNSLGIKLAQKNKVKVIPMAIKTDFWANGKKAKDLGHLKRNEPIHIKFGEPLSVTGNGKEQHQYCIDFIQKHLKKWNKN